MIPLDDPRDSRTLGVRLLQLLGGDAVFVGELTWPLDEEVAQGNLAGAVEPGRGIEELALFGVVDVKTPLNALIKLVVNDVRDIRRLHTCRYSRREHSRSID